MEDIKVLKMQLQACRALNKSLADHTKMLESKMGDKDILVEAMRDVLNGLYALRDHTKSNHGPEAAMVEQRLIDKGIEALKLVGVK